MKLVKRSVVALLVVALVASFCSCLFAQAAADVTLAIEAYYGIEDGNINYAGTDTEGIPDDLIAVAITVSGEKTMNAVEATIKWDPTALELFRADPTGKFFSTTDLLEIATYKTTNSGPVYGENSNNIANGQYNFGVYGDATVDWTYKAGLKSSPFTNGAVVFLLFKPLNVAANAKIDFVVCDKTGITYSTIAAGGEGDGKRTLDLKPLEFTINGGAAALDPIVSLGSKVNTEKAGIRFGAQYAKVAGKTVKEVGTLLIKSDRLFADGVFGATLDLADVATDANKVAKVLAANISAGSFVNGQAFDDYASFIYYATITGIPEAQQATNITAVPYVLYADNTVEYGEALARNYQDVCRANQLFDGNN